MFGLGIAEVVILLFLVGGGVIGSIFWVWMLIDCITKEPSQGTEKLVWVVLIALTHVIGAMIYCVVRRPKRIATSGQ